MSLTTLTAEVVVNYDGDLATAASQARAVAERVFIDTAQLEDLVLQGSPVIDECRDAYRMPDGSLELVRRRMSREAEAELADRAGVFAPNALVVLFDHSAIPTRTFMAQARRAGLERAA